MAAGSLVPAAAAYAEQLSLIVLNIDGHGQVPAGWQVKVNRGAPDIASGEDPEGPFVRLRSRRSSYALERSVDVDPEALPYLHWRWKVTELPLGGDFRHSRTGDQAAQVLLAFADPRVITYIWDTTAPKGTMQCRSGAQGLRLQINSQHTATSAESWFGEVSFRKTLP